MMKKFGRSAMVLALAASTTLVAACATETAYRPATGSGFYRTGYSDIRIEPNRFRVTFAGNTVTDRDVVERYLLFRSAELTLQNGYDYFVMADRDTDRQARTYSTPGFGGGWGPGFGAFGGGLWGPRWGFYGRGFGYRAWDPFWGGPWGGWGGGQDIRTVDRYEASAEIVMFKGTPERGNVRAFNARAVVDSIGPTIRLPKAQ
ncbi:CC0125/CC1285 family lipoprotein [uncultured Sphingomonas sp.]|uniref:CC0125/CC1285 family lipoprotein n=1 Tax=uncultured Sphingomonas sp. TaxID=158754 RepID=UPI003749BAE4